MAAIDIDHLRSWIGVEEEATDIVTPGLVARFEATLAGLLPASAHAPLGIHWCLTQPAAPAGSIGEDGHPKRGGFLPPVPLTRRMWAGGEVTFDAPIEVGDQVTRISRIVDVARKSGRSGELVFVTVEHLLHVRDRLAIRERQDIVYREAASGASATATMQKRAEVKETVRCDIVMLFRYSAITFNGHRIHYDRDYAVGSEHYAGLVVHGPLQATCLMNFAARLNPERQLRRVAYRGVAPLTENRSFTQNASANGTGVDLWTDDADGSQAMTMVAIFDAL